MLVVLPWDWVPVVNSLPASQLKTHVGRVANSLPGPQLWMRQGQSLFDGRTKLLVECWFRGVRGFCHGRLIRRGAAIDDARVRGVRERNAARARNGSILLFARGSLFSTSSFVNILGHTKSM